MSKSYRIRTEIGVDKYINVNLEQDWENLEILSLKILANNVYTRFCADYGVVTGRVFVNGGFGLPNAKVSVFIPLEPADELNPIISELYPYKTITDTNEEGYRYNLLPKLPSYQGHVSTGSFPNKGDVLMDESYIEVYDKYYRFTVTTNESGDFMIFGVPVGNQTIVMDVDLSDIGCFSLSPQDLILQGSATESQVNGARFKSSTNLRELPQVKNLIFDVDVRPFWGGEDLCQIGITRVDFDLTKQANIKLEPTAIFMGSLVSNTDDDALKVGCKPKNNTGNLCELVAGPGEVQSIRHTIFSDTSGLPILERYQVEEGGKVIDGDGTYLINLPMNLDYVITNEFGQQVLSNDPTKGVPTKGRYRFKFKWQNQQGLQNSFLRADFLVPNVKEYGWSTSNNDPAINLQTNNYSYPQIPVGSTTGTTVTFPSSGGLINPITFNVESYVIYINGNLYTGSPESIPVTPGQTLLIVSNPVNTNQAQDIQFTFVPQALFDVYRSYAFSTDWDDYVNLQEALDCEDTFYEFGYNKVYTTAMFLDRYKNGIGRARHLGIKEIDDRTCKSNVNTFPVNDIIRNFDPIFFVFNILINILTFPILTLLFVAHFIAFTWPILKFVLIVLGIYLSYDAAVALAESIQTAIAVINFASSIISLSLAGPVVDVGAILEVVRLILWGIGQVLVAAFKLALAVGFTAFAVILAIRVKGFPRIGLPMITYPDCTSCECDCKNADLGDDFDTTSVNSQVEQQAANNANNQQGSNNTVLSVPKSIIAPVNYSGSFEMDHPNLQPFDPNDPYPPCDSLATLLGQNPAEITQDLVVRASLDFRRLASGYDVISSTDPNRYVPNESYLLKAPQPFLFGAQQNIGSDVRYFAYPQSVTLSQKLNEFNTRDKFFYNSTSNALNTGVNRIRTWVNPTININPAASRYEDQVLVILMRAGTSSQLGAGNLITFQDPNYVNPNFVSPANRLTNLTGATLNQFQTNSITGTTKTGSTVQVNLSYANPANPSDPFGISRSFLIDCPQISQLSVPGNTTVEQSFLKYPTDMEYFQLVTGYTVSDFLSLSNQITPGFYPSTYLLHDISYVVNNCNVSTLSIPDVIKKMGGWEDLEVCLFVRGVDPNTPKQTVEYDLSIIFGKSFGQGPIISGSYYLNYPIQPTSIKPIEHDSLNNSVAKLYFPSFTFTPDNLSFSSFTSDYPYYYLSTDDSISNNYSPYPGQWATNLSSTSGPLTQTLASSTGRNLPLGTQSFYMVGGTYIRYRNNISTTQTILLTGNNNSPVPCNPTCQTGEYFNTGTTFYSTSYGGNLTALYSPAYYRYSLNGVNFNQSNRIVMRSDRLPTSSGIQNGPANTQTGFALHQNDNFTFFLAEGAESQPVVSAGADLPSGDQQDLDPFTSGITETLTCEGMVPLECYSGTGNNVGVIPYGQCSIPADRMVNGCYCLLNKDSQPPINLPFIGPKNFYLIRDAYESDAKLFLEWKVRFTLNFAACRGVFAQVFQNNWINGVLYMFNFNKRTSYNALAEPVYNYCQDVLFFNPITNNFFYRSSPWNKTTNSFVGKDSPSITNNTFINFPGYGYNVKQIQFPTTVVDMGPRDYFINQVCCSAGESGFGSYYADQVKATSYQDNSDIVQLGFLSRILNDGVRQRIIPITTGGNNSEGKGIIQFFNSTRGGYRIDGDWAQMLSINSEWKVDAFISENLNPATANQYIYFGDNTNNNPGSLPPDQIKPILGLFFSSDTPELRYRKIMSPGIETYQFSPLIQDKFGYPKSQVVPHYKWRIERPQVSFGIPNIFGSENNNWYTNTIGGSFFNKSYQDLDFTTASEKYRTQTTNFGYITNFLTLPNGTQVPNPNSNNVLQGAPLLPTLQNVQLSTTVVGAPYHFYFGLNNGKTAIDRFYKLYVATEQE